MGGCYYAELIKVNAENNEVQTLGELRMRDTANIKLVLVVCVYSWSPASSVRRV